MSNEAETSCGACQYFKTENDAFGRCYRFPRQRLVNLITDPATGEIREAESSNYPMQAPTDYCGEHKSRAVN